MIPDFQLKIRLITPSDNLFLRELLYEAIFIPEGIQPFPKSIIEDPEISKYVANWGKPGDIGLIAFNNELLIGAVWCRLFDKEHKGYGFIDPSIPELSMALLKEYRNKGLGADLLNEFLIIASQYGYESISLSVDKRNRAFDFYLKHGFIVIEEQETAYTMMIEI